MTNTTLTTNDPAEIVERVVLAGDLARLTPADRVTYYNETCRSIGLNPLTRPFEYISLNGKLTLYARKDATDQLRKIYSVSLTISGRDRLEDVYIVTARATLPNGRTDESTGVVSLGNLKGDNLANALMKAETKAKRRVTLSICGLGWLDETEMQTIADARPVTVDVQTGEIIQSQSQPQPQPQQAVTINGNLKRKAEVTPEAAAVKFWDHFESVLGSREWLVVQRLLDTDQGEPSSVEGWRGAWKAVDAALAAELDNAA